MKAGICYVAVLMGAVGMGIAGAVAAENNSSPLTTDACPELVQHAVDQIKAHGYEPKCQCGSILKNLQVTLPKELTLAGVCDLSDSSGRPIDLRKETISLDRYPQDGGWYRGNIFFSGRLELHGTVQAGPAGDSGNMWFRTNLPLLDKSSALSSYFGEFSLSHNLHGRILNSPYKGGTSQDCWVANAIVLIDGVAVTMSEQDTNGASPVQIKALEVSEYKRCGN